MVTDLHTFSKYFNSLNFFLNWPIRLLIEYFSFLLCLHLYFSVGIDPATWNKLPAISFIWSAFEGENRPILFSSVVCQEFHYDPFCSCVQKQSQFITYYQELLPDMFITFWPSMDFIFSDFDCFDLFLLSFNF